jgi:hypothetical protein
LTGSAISVASTNSKPRLTPRQANWCKSKAKDDKSVMDTKYSAALKEATLLYALPTNTLGSRKLAASINKKHQLVDRILNYKTLQNYTKNGIIGRSPEKRGPAARLPLPFMELLESHISMTQLEGREETKPRHLKTLIGAALKNTKFKDVSVNKCYERFRHQFPDTVCPMRTMEMEERRSLWTTYPNVNRWFDGTKACLIEYGFAEDKPQRVLDMFEGRMAPPCPIDGKHGAPFHCHTLLLLPIV